MFTVDDSYFKEHACEHADLWKSLVAVVSFLLDIIQIIKWAWCSMVHVPKETYITDYDIQGYAFPLMTMSYMRTAIMCMQ